MKIQNFKKILKQAKINCNLADITLISKHTYKLTECQWIDLYLEVYSLSCQYFNVERYTQNLWHIKQAYMNRNQTASLELDKLRRLCYNIYQDIADSVQLNVIVSNALNKLDRMN